MNFPGIDRTSPLLSISVDAPGGDPADGGLGRLRHTSLRFKGLVVAQFPNLSIAVWFVAAVMSNVASGKIESVAAATAVVALTAWASLELAEGVNWFRRALGAAMLVYVIIRLTDVLPA